MARTPKPWFDKERGVWKVTINGRRHNLGPDKSLAVAEFHRLMAQPGKKKVLSHSLPGIIDSFLEWVQRNRAPDTYEWYRYRLQRFIDRHKTLRLQDLRPYHVQNWVDSYEGLSNTSRRNYIRSVKRCFSWATKQGYIDHNPVANLEAPTADRKEVLISPSEYEAILSNTPDASFRDLITTTWLTGCRPQESLRVEARHVDFQHHRWVLKVSESKGKRAPRIVYLTGEAMEITRRLVATHPSGALFRNQRGQAWSTDAVNCGFDRIQVRMGKLEMKRRGIEVGEIEIEALVPKLRPTRSVKGRKVSKSLKELRGEAKRKLTARLAATMVPRCSLYALRHSWATHALESGVDSVTVAVLMGHADASTLARVYQHLGQNPEYLLQQAQKATTA